MSGDHAEYYQAHKDDDDEWGEPERSPAPARRRLASMISVRFSPDEVRWVRAAAARVGQSVSTFIREATLQRSHRVAFAGPSFTGHVANVESTQSDQPVTTGGPSPSDEVTWTTQATLLEVSNARLRPAS